MWRLSLLGHQNIAPLWKASSSMTRTSARNGRWPALRAARERLTDVEDSYDKRYNELLLHDLRRQSAVRNLVRAGVPERVAMAISGHKTCAVFDRYNITSEQDVVEARRMVQAKSALSQSESSLRAARKPTKLLK